MIFHEFVRIMKTEKIRENHKKMYDIPSLRYRKIANKY